MSKFAIREVQAAGDANGCAKLHWLGSVLKRDLDDATAWFEAALKAQVAAKGSGPVAVS